MTAQKRLDIITEALDTAYGSYCDAVQRHADDVFDHDVRPLLNKHEAIFNAGNGSWHLEIRGVQLVGLWSRAGIVVNEGRNRDERRIIDLLSIQIPGMRDVDLGCFMPDYPQTEGKI